MKLFRCIVLIAFSYVLALTTPVFASDETPEEPQSYYRQNAWTLLDEAQRKDAFALSENYKAFVAKARHELSSVEESVKLAKAKGFKNLDTAKTLKAGDKVFTINRDRAVIFAVLGKSAILKGGVVATASHIDSPRLELKPNPLGEKQGFAMFQTAYHGGIKKYQWVNIPLALVGRVDKKDGTSVKIEVGLNDGRPFIIPDMAPHEDKDFRDRSQRDVIKGEELDVIAGSIPDDSEDSSVEAAIEALLEKEYGISREDFVSAELALVPALPPSDIGFDRGLVAAYGHDDRLCSFAALRALLDMKGTPQRTAMVYFADNEESGSNNATGAKSPFFNNTVAELMEKSGEALSQHALRKALSKSLILSADTTTGINPIFPGTQEETNAASVGGGVVVKLYGWGNNPDTKVTAKIRKLLDDNEIPWQTHMYKVDTGGGGTLGGFISDDGADVVDVGVGILSMHSPYAVASKADIFCLYRFFGAAFSE